MYPNRDFSRSTVKALAVKGICIVSSTILPDDSGNFANGDVAYVISNRGEHQIRRHSEVLALAK
jgi:hypothetical protein